MGVCFVCIYEVFLSIFGNDRILDDKEQVEGGLHVFYSQFNRLLYSGELMA